MIDKPDSKDSAVEGGANKAMKLDFSTGKPGSGRSKPTGLRPVVQKTINLSTKKVAPPPEPVVVEKPRASPKPNIAPKREKPRSPSSSGTSLADLLDPETLARLRGEG